MREYNAMNNEEFKQKDRDFNELHQKMAHIKGLVAEYDNVHYKKGAAPSSTGDNRGSHSHHHGGDRTDRNRMSVASR